MGQRLKRWVSIKEKMKEKWRIKSKIKNGVSEENTRISKTKAITKDKGKLSQAEEI